LSFAVAEKGGQTIIVLRVRPSKHAAPVLVLPGAVAFRSFLKLPNLFLPIGSRLHPPLRRDAVRKLLADDPAQITWLYPEEDRGFTPETLPDTAFRPLPDWIDYVLDHDRAALQAWVEATQFEFEAFICNEDDPSKPRKPPGSSREKSSRQRRDDQLDLSSLQNVSPTKGKAREEREAGEEFAAAPKLEPNKVQQLLRALEDRFLRLEGPLDSPERQAFWPELAELNMALGTSDDAGLCWTNTLWHTEAPGGLAWKWFASEATRVAARSAE